jgi:integrase
VAKFRGNRSRDDVRYWQGKVFRKHYGRAGGHKEVSDFSARLQLAGRREYFNLGTPNKAAAAERARVIYRYLVANGWEKTLELYKPHSAPGAVGPVQTVGELVTRLRASETGNLQTFEDYVGRFRQLLSGVLGLERSNSRYDVYSGGRAAWAKKTDVVLLAELTPEKINAWKRTYLVRAGSHRAREKSARVTLNSILRKAAGLFAKRRLARAGLSNLVSPFAGVEFERRPSMRYRSSFDIAELTAAAQAELGTEEFKAYLLAAFCGLRRDEIDKLGWSAFRWEQGILRLEVTEHFVGKSEESVADIDLEDQVLAIFRGFHAQAHSPFVIESPLEARHATTYRHYRAAGVFKRLSAWLRAHGVVGHKPLHVLRKEYGSQIADKLGIYAASRALRHSDIKVTAEHYLEKKRRITPGLGSLLKQPQNVTGLTSADRDGSVGQPESAHG